MFKKIFKNNSKVSTMSQGYTAFTLAEVLITLGVIGVIAAITIPILLQATSKQTYATSLKKFYVNFNQVLQQVNLDNSCTNDLKCTKLFASGTTQTSLGTNLVKYFKITKDCGVSTTDNCFASATNSNYDDSGSTDSYNRMDGYKFLTVDGMSVYIENYIDNCTSSWSSGVGTDYMSQVCGLVAVDVNGPQKPNRWGIDAFFFFITNAHGSVLYPMGGINDKSWGVEHWWNGTNKTCQTGATIGYYCAGRVIDDGWEMKY